MPSTLALKQRRFLVWLGIASFGMFFAAGLMGYVIIYMAMVDKPQWSSHQLPIIFYFSVFTLLVTEVVLQLGLHRIRRQKPGQGAWYLTWASVMGAVFIVGQVVGLWDLLSMLAARREAHALTMYGLMLFLAGTHLAHVLVIYVVLVLVTVRAWQGRYDHEYHWGPTFCLLSWRFLDVVWLVSLAVFWVTL